MSRCGELFYERELQASPEDPLMKSLMNLGEKYLLHPSNRVKRIKVKNKGVLHQVRLKAIRAGRI